MGYTRVLLLSAWNPLLLDSRSDERDTRRTGPPTRLSSTMVRLFSRPRRSDPTPSGVEVEARNYVTQSQAPSEALETPVPYLQGDALDDLVRATIDELRVPTATVAPR